MASAFGDRRRRVTCETATKINGYADWQRMTSSFGQLMSKAMKVVAEGPWDQELMEVLAQGIKLVPSRSGRSYEIRTLGDRVCDLVKRFDPRHPLPSHRRQIPIERYESGDDHAVRIVVELLTQNGSTLGFSEELIWGYEDKDGYHPGLQDLFDLIVRNDDDEELMDLIDRINPEHATDGL